MLKDPIRIAGAIAAVALSGLAGAALAQTPQTLQTPVGTWRSFDEKTGQPKSEIVISEHDGVLSGRIARLLRPGVDPDARCTECRDARQGLPLVGLEIIWGARQAEGKSVWEDGQILDPENGKSYTLRLTPADEGRKLDVRGSIGPFGRTQTWVRVP